MPRFLRASLTVLAPALACSAFYPPKEKDDGVQRCDNVEDCDLDPQAAHFDWACVHGESQDQRTQKVCVPVYVDKGCNPEDGFPDTHPYVEKWTAATESPAYVGCQDANLGQQGCPADMGMCAGDLVNENGVCDDLEAKYPAVPATNDLAGVDVRDQFCRSFFCDDSWVCDSTVWKCRQCDPEREFGEGGCGELWLDGVKSTVYTDDVAGACPEGGFSNDRDVDFGPVP